MRLNSIDLIDQEQCPEGETSDYLVSGSASEETQEEMTELRRYKVVRSLLQFQRIILDGVLLTRCVTGLSREHDDVSLHVVRLV